MMTREIIWAGDDTPIPKIGQIITNLFHEQFRVIHKRKSGKDYEITIKFCEQRTRDAQGRFV